LQNTLDINDLIVFEKFMRNLAKKIDNKEFTDALNKVSIFKKTNMKLLNKLANCVNKKQTIKILYNSPNSGKKEITVITDKLGIYRNNIYLYGISLEYKQDTSYLVSRIINIVDIVEDTKTPIEIKPITVGYELGTLTPNVKLAENEKIVEIKENSVIIEAQTTNLFMMKRRILDYGGICTVLYPEDFRNDIINTLKEMREVYNNG
jgi:predicted DNA-binding transcriptional regulator YafY